MTWQSIKGTARAIEEIGERDERDFRSVLPEREHRLAKEAAAEQDTVQAADQSAGFPGFHRVGISQVMQGGIGGFDLGVNPGAGLIAPRRGGAGVDDRSEGRIEGDRIPPFADHRAEAARDLQLVGLEDQAGVGRPPEDRVAGVVPGEDPVAIAREQASDGEIAADGEQSVGPCRSMRGKNQRLGEQLHRPLVDHVGRIGRVDGASGQELAHHAGRLAIDERAVSARAREDERLGVEAEQVQQRGVVVGVGHDVLPRPCGRARRSRRGRSRP